MTTPTHVLKLPKGAVSKPLKVLGMRPGAAYFGRLQADGGFALVDKDGRPVVVPAAQIASSKAKILRYREVPEPSAEVRQLAKAYALHWD